MTDDIHSLFANSAAQRELAVKYIEMLKATKQASKRVTTTYRCERRCALLEAYNTVHGIILYFPRYKLSEQVNAQDSSEAGRLRNTEDGHRHWKSSADFLVPNLSLPVQCDHERISVQSDDVAAAVSAGTREVIVNR